jgi:hypothetical protein
LRVEATVFGETIRIWYFQLDGPEDKVNPMERHQVSETTIEQYSMGKLVEPELGKFEEHYLICPRCQNEVAAMDAYLTAMRRAATRFEQPRTSLLELAWMALAGQHVRMMVPALAAVLCLLIVFVPRPEQKSRTVRLEALRGGTQIAAVGTSGSRLTLDLDLRGIDVGSNGFVELASASGDVVINDRLLADKDRGKLELKHSLRPGRYWVRIYRDPSRDDLLREFGLTIP